MADPVTNEHGLTELHLAAYHGELDWVQNCLRGDLNVHARDKDGFTPLHWLVDMGMVGDASEREQIALALLEAGADVNACDTSGRSVLTVAEYSESDYLARILIEAGAVRKGEP